MKTVGLSAATSSIVPFIIGSASFMQQLDSTIIATALPSIAESMNDDPIRLNLAITSYLLAVAIFIPISGWMADKFGARLIFRSAILIFTVSSVLCGLSESLPMLVAARMLQGVGGAMMVPVGRLVILKTTPKADLVRAMTYLTIPAVIGPVLGPPIGGFIVTFSSWRWIFFINVPIGILGIILVSFVMREVKEEDPPPFDFWGFTLAGIGLATLVFGLESLGKDVVPTEMLAAMILGGSVLMAIYFRHARNIDRPMVDLKVFKFQTFYASVVGGILIRLGMGALPFLLAILLQLGFGLDALTSGLITFASAAGSLTMKFTVRPIIRWFGFRRVLIWNAVIVSLFFVSYAGFRDTTPHWLILVGLLAGGFFRSLQFTSLNTLMYADVPQPMMSRASTIASMIQQLNQSIGIGLAGLLIHLSLHLRGHTVIAQDDIWPVFIAMAFTSLLSLFFFLPLSPHAGAELSGRRLPTMGQKQPGGAD